MDLNDTDLNDMDLRPREVVPTAVGRARKRPWLAYSVLALVLVAGGFVVAKFLTSAIDYYCNVDEVGHKSGCDVGRDIRIQGVVEKGSVAKQGALTNFVVGFNGVTMPVQLSSQPTGLFQECIPVVVVGRAVKADDGTVSFMGNDLLVKHSNDYVAANKDRIAKADQEAAACSAT
jgi:cytochrome c-type biogenesis protein CcmE